MLDNKTACASSENQKIRHAALNYLGRREYTELALQKKLSQKGYARSAIQTVLQQLIRDGLLDDVRFCEAFIVNRIRQCYGPVKIRAELLQQGVNETVTTTQLQQNESAWLDCIKKIMQKKFTPPEDLKEKYRQICYLQSRGFRLEQIKKCIENNEF